MVSGAVAKGADRDVWLGFEAANIVPVAHEAVFLSNHLDAYVTDQAGINSPQNGILMKTDLRQLFDQYFFAINPFKGYKIYTFQGIDEELDGTVLGASCCQPDDPHHVSDMLLYWHFKQAVLANMRGAGEPVYEHDFPPGSDQIGHILQGPQPGERMEFELASRLHGLSS